MKQWASQLIAPKCPCRFDVSGATGKHSLRFFVVGGFSGSLAGANATFCDSKVPNAAEDEDDEDFDFNFAKPPVVSAPIQLKFSVQVKPSEAGQRPTADIQVHSTLSLPVERGWPRDQLEPKDVASFMAEVLADRLPRFAADFWNLHLVDAPLQLRGYQQWSSEHPAQLRSTWLPKICPACVMLQRLPSEIGFDLGPSGKLTVACEPVGVQTTEDGERLDLQVSTALNGFPVAGAAWGWLGCGGRWWFERFRLPTLRKMLQAYHEMVHEQMMLYYVAALKN